MKQNQKTKKINKEKSTAILRSLINKNTTIRRLHKDLENIIREDIPIVGVAALPLENDLFKWHGNIRGPVGTFYEGGVFHFEIQIPELYPHLPPKIVLFNPLPHPNVIENTNICLDMLSTQWSSNYSILSILLQLQGYLFEDAGEHAQHIVNIKQAIKVANQYRCSHCKHKSKYAEWPPFNRKEQQLQSFYNLREAHKIIEDNFICFHTKLSYRKIDDSTEKQDSCLGILLNITKTPKTGLIKSAQPSLDYISIKGFMNEGIRKDSEGNRFTHWLPLYFGNLDNKERVFHLLKKSISMIITNNTRSFKIQYILEVFPSILLSVIVSVSNEKIHPSVKYLRILTQVYALWLLCMEEWPELYTMVDDRLNKFISEEQSRTKDSCPNLGIIYILLYVSKQFRFKDLIKIILNEQFDRQVFWLIKEIPELDDETLQDQITPSTRAEISFKQQQSSYKMICLQYLYLQITQQHPQLLSQLTHNYCFLNDKQEIQLQQEIVRIQQNIDSYNSFYDFIQLPRQTNEELDILLRTAIKNSRNKKYHGSEENINVLPSISEQMQNIIQNQLKFEDYFDIQVNKVDNEFEYIIDFKQQFAQFIDEDWKEETIKRFEWVKMEISWNPEISPTELAQIANHISLNKQQSTRDRLYSQMMAENNKYTQEAFLKIPFPQHTWLQLFAKLHFEQYLLCLPYLTDLKEFYKKLYCSQQYILDLVYPIQLNTKIKNDNFLSTTINILRLQSLTLFNLYNIKLPERISTQINKGLQILQKQEDCQLKQIHFINITFDDINYYQSIYSSLKNFSAELEVFQLISSTTESEYRVMDDFGHIFSKLKKLQYLILNDCINGKITADSLIQGLTISNKNFQQNLFTAIFTGENQELSQKSLQELRMGRQLEYVDLSNNERIPEQSIADIVNGLSMFPNLKYLNLSKICEIKSQVFVNSLVQLINTSVNLQILDCSNIIGLNPKLENSFFISLAENNSLNTLRLCNSGKITEKQMELLALATYWNNRNGGKLKNLNLNKTNSTFASFEAFCMKFQWNGRHSYTLFKEYKYIKADKKKLNFSIHSLEQSDGDFQFDEKDFQKKFEVDENKKEEETLFSQYLKFFQTNSELNTLNFQNNSMKSNGITFLTLFMTNPKFKCQIKILNLSRNQLGISASQALSKIIINSNVLEVLDISNNDFRAEGSKVIALALHINSSIKSLNFFNNKIGVEGAKAFGQALKFNTQLAILDLGHNSIRNKGLIFLVKGLSQNKSSKLRVLGLRFNFLTQTSISLLLVEIKTLHSVFLRNNQVNCQGLLLLKSIQSPINVDLFDNCLYYSKERMQRTIWVQPQFSIPQLIKFCKEKELGIVVDVRTRNGIIYPNRKVCANKFNFIEFADPNSVSKAMSLASMGNALIEDKLFRIYQAGTGTFVYLRKSSKQKKVDQITILEQRNHLNQNVNQ